MAEPVDLNFVTTDVWGGSVLQWATPFTDVKHLVDQAIAKLGPGQCIRRLVITGHGAENTDGFFVFDPETQGIQLIDGGTKQPISPSVVAELQRLKTHFCKDAVIEFRVCRFGSGKKGEKAMQAVADAVGVAVTAPMGEISSLAAIGGLATDWRVAYPRSWGLPSSTSFWRGSPTRQPPGASSPADIAPITGQVVPLRAVTTPPSQTATLPPVGKVSIANPQTGSVPRGVAATGAVLVVGGVILGWIAFNSLLTPAAPIANVPSPTIQPTSPPAPSAQPTEAPTEQPTATPIQTPATAPTAEPTPTSTPAIAHLPDGIYVGSGPFASYDGRESYATSWQLTKSGDEVEIAQLLRPGGAVFQVQFGIVDPAGLLVAASDDPAYCEVLVLDFAEGQPGNEMFVAYGPPQITCPNPNDLALVFQPLRRDPAVLEDALRTAYGWGSNVTIGSVAIEGWTTE